MAPDQFQVFLAGLVVGALVGQLFGCWLGATKLRDRLRASASIPGEVGLQVSAEWRRTLKQLGVPRWFR